MNPIDNFDYNVGCDDFFLYELGRLIEEERASLEDEEFRRLIDAGVHEHIERRLDIRTEMAARFRQLQRSPDRTLRLIEDIEAPLREIPLIVQSYTKYLLTKLEQCAGEKPDEKVEAAADLLLEWPEDRATIETALATLGSIRSAVSARVLAHVISEPLVEEDLEIKAYDYVRGMWPLPRPYILYSLKPHTHEDLPFRWFQLFVDCNEPSTVDRILEEVLVHADNPNYREDLLGLVELLSQSRDPGAEDKVLQVINSEESSRAARDMLGEFLRNTKAQNGRLGDFPEPWNSLEHLYAANKKYMAAAMLLDSGRKADAAFKLDELLKEQPGYPFALMLKQLL